ncbi:P1 family peptidase [Brevibacillus sp. 7WMA2]|uniref:P1 family peptidase n=1 Tax=Brevibacillus TaxID=55080 RepID=UPI0013A73107|nr:MULTISPECIES: P1 family peptidase [Brevibacillus]MCR8995145.1 P1 family peptidase [Brevibacillus laterosporus]QIC04400.1 P1 family peptidase [Brevibacillus sp. 7WMA2]WPS89537.1 P1 family peptidase [Brevibacillus halotolerans]
MTATIGSIVDIKGIKVGHQQDEEALTGCTVLLMEEGAVCGVDVRGSAPGTRETDLLSPINKVDQVHGICLSGGSAFGLDAASGVMRYLEEQGIGLDVKVAKVPIVPAAVLFDLAIGDASIRPTMAMGYEAAKQASEQVFAEGNIGAGCGATVGKMAGFERAMKGGLGTASRELGNGLVIGAIVAVNAVGEVRCPVTGERLAGVRGENEELLDIYDCMEKASFQFIPTGANTTIGVVACNATLTKSEANKVAQMAHDGLARTIYPIHTMHDGDTIFAIGTGEVQASVDVIGALAAEVLAEAVVRAIKAAEPAGTIPSYRSRQDEKAEMIF